jgi:hypothetical protein
MPSGELFGENVEFLDVRVLEPEKTVKFGLADLKKHQKLQMHYLKNDEWKIARRGKETGPVLAYRSTTWTLKEKQPAPEPSEKETPDTTQAAAGEKPGGIWDVLKCHPGDKVLEETKLPNLTMVRLSSSDPADKIAKFYKDDLTSKCWVQLAAVNTAEEVMLMMSKEDQNVAVMIHKKEKGPDGKLVYELTHQTP